jgi:hypothetical protein
MSLREAVLGAPLRSRPAHVVKLRSIRIESVPHERPPQLGKSGPQARVLFAVLDHDALHCVVRAGCRAYVPSQVGEKRPALKPAVPSIGIAENRVDAVAQRPSSWKSSACAENFTCTGLTVA